jgi:hypothetical protein
MITVVLRGDHGGELDRREVAKMDDVPRALNELAEDCTFANGDTITIEGDES